MTGYVGAGAKISPDGRYRYLLWREWRGTHDPKNWRWVKEDDGSPVLDGGGHPWGEPKACLFVMLNPSTADGDADDPTIRRCVNFAKAWKFERLEVVNLFAYRATNPRHLLGLGHDDDPGGVLNQENITRAACDAGLIVCAWGAHGSHLDQHETVLGWLGGRQTYCLGKTKEGHPRHPLYLKSDVTPSPHPRRQGNPRHDTPHSERRDAMTDKQEFKQYERYYGANARSRLQAGPPFTGGGGVM